MRWSTYKVYPQTVGEYHEEGSNDKGKPLDVLGVVDEDADEDGPEARADVVDLAHVAGEGDR